MSDATGASVDSSPNDSPSSNLPPAKNSAFAPLKEKVFRRIWTASVLSNFGQLILGVGVAWEMTRLTDSSTMVALVQTAMMLPLMLVALPAGAIADMFDRRKVAMSGLCIAIVFSSTLSVLAYLGLTTPWVLLAFCSLIGTGVAFYYPAWNSSIGEQVTQAALPAAIALNSISYNVARSFGPAVGGLIVLALGAQAAFAVNAIAYLPLLLALFVWQRVQVSSRLPPERISRAIVSGMRYALHSSPIRTVLIRVCIFTFGSATANALAPLIAKDLLHGDAGTFGILLGATGVGAVLGALLISRIHETFTLEQAVSFLAVTGGLSFFALALSHNLIVSCLAMMLAGAMSMVTISLMNITVQISVPRWVIARALSLYSSLLTAGVAVGAWFWGSVADHWSIEISLLASGAFLLLLPLLAFVLPMPNYDLTSAEQADFHSEPEVNLPVTMRSGPIVIEIEYQVEEVNAREYYDAMQAVRKLRMRNGGFDWTITRDIADPELWIERFHLPTWGDYLRMRDRLTQADMAAMGEADKHLKHGAKKHVRRGLERPLGSVRWKTTTPDNRQDNSVFMGP